MNPTASQSGAIRHAGPESAEQAGIFAGLVGLHGVGDRDRLSAGSQAQARARCDHCPASSASLPDGGAEDNFTFTMSDRNGNTTTAPLSILVCGIKQM